MTEKNKQQLLGKAPVKMPKIDTHHVGNQWFMNVKGGWKAIVFKDERKPIIDLRHFK